jgi:hypothetical protein
MPKSVDEITVGANGSVLVAQPGSDVPDDVDEALGSDWLDLGFTSEAGVQLTDAKTLVEIPVWQLFYPARRIVTARDFRAVFVLRQWAAEQVKLGFGGGEIAESSPGSGLFRYTPPSPEFVDERMVAVEWTDGDKHYRLILLRCMVVENVQTTVARTAASDIPITVGVIGAEGEDPWILDTDDPAFAEAS